MEVFYCALWAVPACSVWILPCVLRNAQPACGLGAKPQRLEVKEREDPELPKCPSQGFLVAKLMQSGRVGAASS